MTLDLAKYGITDVKEVVHNPSYEQLHKDETAEGLVGYEKGVVTELGAINVMTASTPAALPKISFSLLTMSAKTPSGGPARNIRTTTSRSQKSLGRS